MVFLFCCTSDKNGVYLSELSNAPEIRRETQIIYIHLKNSIKHSGRSIFKLKVTKNDRKLLFRAFQRASGVPFVKYQNDFTLDLNKYNLPDGESFSLCWLDPDGKETVLANFQN